MNALFRSAIPLLCFVFLSLTSSHLLGLNYQVTIEGISEASMSRQLKSVSQAFTNQSKGASSLTQLKHLVDNDCEAMRRVAVYNGFLSCSIQPSIIQAQNLTVVFHVDLGPRYSLQTLYITWSDKQRVQESCPQDLLDQLLDREPTPLDVPSFATGRPAEGNLLLSFERELISNLASKGFFTARAVSTQFIAHPEYASVDVQMEVETGPLLRFGPVTVLGTKDVKESFITSKLSWNRGELYDKRQIEETEARIQKTGLFQTVIIDCIAPPKDAAPVSGVEIPVTVTVVEAKQKTVGARLSYTTTLGAGASFEWEHRNIRGVGERLSFRADVWQKMRDITLTYTLPHWKKREDNTLFIIEHDHQTYLPYHSSAIKGSVLREQKISKYTEIVWGGRIERLESTRLIANRIYHLTKLPLQLRWSTANSPWDPTSGMALNVKVTPSYQYIAPHFAYLISQATWSGYESFYDDSMTVAAKLSLGSILGAGRSAIPVPDRFFGGTENSLRGYKTGTVAPLNKKREPIGGRSFLTGTLELRNRYANGLGSVFFYDVGNVFRSPIPDFSVRHILHSVGAGIRYTTPLGPIRLDVAVPINKRRGIDPPFQIYFSIGQAF